MPLGNIVAVEPENEEQLFRKDAVPGEEPVNVTAGLKGSTPEGPNEEIDKRIEELLEEQQCLRQQLSDQQAENMQLDINVSRLQSENDELRVQLSRSRRAHAEERAGRMRTKSQYQDMINECAMAPGQLSKKLAEHRSRIEELESGHTHELEQQKEFWGEINAMLSKENDQAQAKILELTEQLESQKEDAKEAREKQKKTLNEMEEDVLKANEVSQEWQEKYELLQLEVSKLRQEKVQLGTKYEATMLRQNQHHMRQNSSEDDTFSTEAMMRMMQETMADHNDSRDNSPDPYEE